MQEARFARRLSYLPQHTGKKDGELCYSDFLAEMTRIDVSVSPLLHWRGRRIEQSRQSPHLLHESARDSYMWALRYLHNWSTISTHTKGAMLCPIESQEVWPMPRLRESKV